VDKIIQEGEKKRREDMKWFFSIGVGTNIGLVWIHWDESLCVFL